MFRIQAIVISMLGLLILNAESAGQGVKLQAVNQVEANVNGKVVTQYDIEESFRIDQIDVSALSETQLQQSYEGRLLQKVLDILTNEATEKAGVSVSEESILNRKTAFIDQTHGTEEAFQTFLTDQGISEEQFDTDFRRRQEAAAWLGITSGAGGGKLNRNLRPRFDLSVTPRAMRRYYKRHASDRFTVKNEAVIRVIQMYFIEGRTSRTAKPKVKTRMRGLKARLATKADFAVLAQKNSQHPSKDKGGLIGPIEMGQSEELPEEIEKLVFSEKYQPGDVIGPYELVNSFWLIRIEDRREARVVPFEEAQLEIKGILRQLKRQKAIRRVQLELVKEAYVSPERVKRNLERYLSRR